MRTVTAFRTLPSCGVSARHAVPSLNLCLHGNAVRTRNLPVQHTVQHAAQRQRRSRCLEVRSAIAEPPVETKELTFPRGAQWEVHKFGGTCVASPERIKSVAEVMLAGPGPRVVVVSAMGSHPSSPVKVTDLLLNMVAKAARQDEAFLLDLAALQEKHLEAAKELLGSGKHLNGFVRTLLNDIGNLKAMLHAISIAGMATEAFTDFVVGHGELWCAQLMAATCAQMGADAAFMDTRDVLVVTPTADANAVDVDYPMSNKKLDMWGQAHGIPKVIIATGFIARNPAGQATTLKRNGSDYSATIMGALFQCKNITIWTDVDGVYSADPRKVPEAVCLQHLSYHEAWELSYFGANVLHPRTTLPAMKYNIPIAIRNFFNLSAPGTMISEADPEPNAPICVLPQFGAVTMVKGFATIDNVALIDVTGTGMVGVPGTASAIFSTMRDANINVIMISQASSEHSVCFAVRMDDAVHAVEVLRARFKDALAAGRLQMVRSLDNCCVLAAVGSQMASRRGVAATMFAALAKSNVNIRAIAQGCSEYNITALIDQADSVKALRAVHARFYLAALPIGVALVGPGLIGATFLDQVKEQLTTLKEEYDIDVRILAVCSSNKMLLSESGLDLASWKEQLDKRGQPADLTRLGDHLAASFIPNTVVVDTTASETPADYYLTWMQQGIHVITPNKKMNSGSLERYQALKQFQGESYTHFFYEGTVGAGLPVLQTLKHLVDTGDKVLKVEGIFSGTLSYIFNTFGPDTPFSQVVSGAKAAGYTEPDPRDDLNGMDVARKVTILARESGLPVELSSVSVESLVPQELQGIQSVDEFMKRLPEFDAAMEARRKEAEAGGEVLRYVGVVDVASGKGSVSLGRYPSTHPFAQLSGSDNIIAFTTQRYFKQPLIIRGPGAGAEVTAGGVFSDLLRLAAYLGAPSS